MSDCESKRWVSDSFLAERYSVHRTTIWRWVKSGRLRRPSRLGENTVRWNLEEADFDVVHSGS